MSRGLGKIQSQLFGLFQKNPTRYFSTEQLCRKIFRIRRVEKKHRVSLIRAIKRTSETQTLDIYRAVVKHSNNDLWFIHGRPNAALNSLLHKAGARNVDVAPAKDRRPPKKKKFERSRRRMSNNSASEA